MPESLRLFHLCDAMRWNHLPVAGGLYDQSPELLEDFFYIFMERNAYEEKKNNNQLNPGTAAVKGSAAARRVSKRRR